MDRFDHVFMRRGIERQPFKTSPISALIASNFVGWEHERQTNTLGTWKPEVSLCCLSLRRLGDVLTTADAVLEHKPKKQKAPQSRPTGRAISVIEKSFYW